MTDGTETPEPAAERLVRALPGGDAALLVGTMLVIYLLFALFSVALLPRTVLVNGTVNTLQRVTFLSAVYAMLALALNLHWGYTGLFNIGVAGFMAVGIYTFAILTGDPGATATTGAPGLGLPLWVGFLGGMVAAAVVGLVAALPALRLRADYLAIVTIAFSEIIRIVFLSTTFQTFTLAGVQLGTGGGSGISFPTPQELALGLFYRTPRNPNTDALTPLGEAAFSTFGSVGIETSVVAGWTYAILLVVGVGAFYWLLARIGNSPFGRVLKAIREDEVVANSLGKNTNRFKVKVFMVGCALMGLGGILWKGAPGFTNPGAFLPLQTFYIFIAVIIGGAGSNTGSVIGGAVFASLLFEGPVFLRRLVENSVPVGQAPPTFVDAVAGLDAGAFLVYTLDNVFALRLVLVGAVLVYLMQRRPKGLLGHRKETAATIDLSVRSGEASPDRNPVAGVDAEDDGGETDE